MEHRPRLPIHRRDWTTTQRVLRACGITNALIAERSGVALSTVNRALTLRDFGNTAFIHVARVRAAVQSMLIDSGWTGDTAALWADYDAALLDGDETPPPRAA